MKAGGSYLPADMVCQFYVQTCADRTGTTTGDHGRLRLIEKAIDAGARDLPHARNSRQTITASNGGRERLAHRLDLLWAKGRLPSSAAILASSSSLSMVISPTLDFSRAMSSSRSSRSRSFNPVAAPASARSRHSVSLATDTFICRATRSSGSPRNSRATIAILRCTEKRFGPFPSTPEGAPAPALGERSGAPSGLSPSSFVMCNTPVEVQFTSAGCLNYPCRTPVGVMQASQAWDKTPKGRYVTTGCTTHSAATPETSAVKDPDFSTALTRINQDPGAAWVFVRPRISRISSCNWRRARWNASLITNARSESRSCARASSAA